MLSIHFKPSHWLLLSLVVLFLLIYFNLLSWGRIEDALEALAAQPAGAQMFAHKVDRADAIFIVFMFLMLTPLALVMVAALIAFVGAVLAGFLESLMRTSGMPDWAFTGFVYLALIVIAFLARSVWLSQAQGFLGLIARAIVAAYS